MKKFVAFLLILLLSTSIQAQDKAEGKQSFCSMLAEKNILNHMDVGVNVGTMGLGIDVAVPVGDYVRVRAGYNYMPSFKVSADFNINSLAGYKSGLLSKVDRIDSKLAEFGVDLEKSGYEDYKEKFDKFRNIQFQDEVTMQMRPKLHQFKFLVDVMPFKNNKHWSFTAGFFVGPSVVGTADNMDKETLLLEGINAYNEIYKDYPEHGIKGTYLHNPNMAKEDPFFKYGLAACTLGSFADGDIAMMVPSKKNTVRAEMEVSKFRPYLGFGYNTHLSKDKKWNLNVDAGILFLCGSPRVYVDNVYKVDAGPLRFDADGKYLSGMGIYADEDGNSNYWDYYGDIVRWNPEEFEFMYCGKLKNHVDIVHDLHDVPGKVGNWVNTISHFKVYPNVSVGVSYRIF